MDAHDQTKRSKGNWLLWWKIDPTELEEQVSKYDTLSVVKSARGIATLCLVFSVAVTVGLAYFTSSANASYVDAALFAVLALFIYLGHRWAMIGAMVLWTIEKMFLIALAVAVVSSAKSGSPNVGGQFAMQIVWWCVFMHAFYLALRVEQARRRLSSQAVGHAG